MSDEILRGIELVKRDPYLGQPIVVAKYRATELAAKQAAADCKWLQWRWPDAGYELRALVSVPRKDEQAPVVEGGGANAERTTDEILADARVAAGGYDVVVPE